MQFAWSWLWLWLWLWLMNSGRSGWSGKVHELKDPCKEVESKGRQWMCTVYRTFLGSLPAFQCLLTSLLGAKKFTGQYKQKLQVPSMPSTSSHVQGRTFWSSLPRLALIRQAKQLYPCKVPSVAGGWSNNQVRILQYALLVSKKFHAWTTPYMIPLLSIAPWDMYLVLFSFLLHCIMLTVTSRIPLLIGRLVRQDQRP